MKRIWALILVLALAAALGAAGAEQSYWFGTMMVDNCEEWVSLRDVPGTGGKRLAKVPLYAIVTEAEWDRFCGDFIYCNYDGQYGYILAKYLVPWSDPEPDINARFVSALGFSIGYDSSMFSVHDMAEDGEGLMMYPLDSEEPVYLEIMPGDGLGVPLEEFLEENTPSDATIEEDITQNGVALRRVETFAANDNDILQVYYTAQGANGGVAAIGNCPFVGGEAWIAQFNAVMRSIDFGPAAPLRADWAEATKRALVVDREGEYVTLMADEPLSDVRLLALELGDVDQDGSVTFNTEVLYGQDALVPDESLVVKIAFPGDIPSYGLAFTDASGAERRFAIGLSGMDGSIQLTEF